MTGADSGIGRAVAIAFAKEGANVLMSYIPEEEADAAEVAGVIEGASEVAIRRPGDIRDPDYARQLVSTVIGEFGRLDLVVNVAGFQMSHNSIDEVSTEKLDRTFRTNVYGTFSSFKQRSRIWNPAQSFSTPLPSRHMNRVKVGGVCRIQSSGPKPDKELCKTGGKARSTGERNRARACMDATHPIHHAS